MADIFHNLQINSSVEKVFNAISTPDGLNEWWTAKASGTPQINSEYVLWFGPEYDWRAIVSKFKPLTTFELHIRNNDVDWNNSTVGFELTPDNGKVNVQFYHKGWPSQNEHFKIASYCWATYLRILKRHLEYGERVAYKDRNDV